MTKIRSLKTQLENLVISNATPEDYDSISDLLKTVNLPVQGVQEHLDNFVVLTDGESIIGTGGLEIYSDKALLRSLAIHSDYQNRGLQNIRELYLLTETAERFFTAIGFETISRELVDEQVKTSEEFRSVCPTTAGCMRLIL